MELVNYLVSNIPLFSICAVMIFIAIRNINVRRRESVYFLVFAAVVLFLSLVVFIEKDAQAKGNVILGTIFTFFGYIFRPFLLYIFVLLANMDQKRSKAFYIICLAPLFLNTIIYIFPLMIDVPVVSKMVFYYQMQADGTAEFVRGGVLNFTSHAVSLFYLMLLVYVSTVRFQGKHRRDGIVLVLCVAIILVTVIAEMLTKRNDLLNITCGICMMINYIFILSINSSRDPLTNLYDRRTYYEDISRYKSLVNGVIQIDMNGLKFLNDNYGHSVGDVALNELAAIFDSSINRHKMCTYRLSGDEFLVLMFQGTNQDLENTVNAIKEKMEESHYSVAIGYCYFDKKDNMDFDMAMKKSEQLMYLDKAKYYKESGHERRKE